MLTKYGYTTIGFVTILSFILLAVSFFISSLPLRILLLVIAVAAMAFTLYFFRDPQRKPPGNNLQIVSPADGKVLLIKKVFEEKFLNAECLQVSIFMSPFNVHVNRIPVDGRAVYLEYIPGEYLMAFDDKASEKNERNLIGIEGEKGKVLFSQVAGFVARRIVCDLQEGQQVHQGERFGMIKFGSRVDVIVPQQWSTSVKEGDIVRAGETVLFEWKEG